MIFALVGQSASGKSTVERLLEGQGYPRIISFTTRPKREGEKDGVDYHFIDGDTFIEFDAKGSFAETASYRSWYYGLSLNGIDYENNDYIVVVTPSGLAELVAVVGEQNIVGIHIKVDERTRIIRQLNRGDDVDEVFRRIQADRIDFAGVENICRYTVLNRTITRTVSEVLNLIHRSQSK